MILNFEQPKRLRSTEKHNEMYSSDSGIAGTYVPNMSEEDKNKWKAKRIGGEDERIEIRKTINGVQLLIVVHKHPYHPKQPKYPTDVRDAEMRTKFSEAGAYAKTRAEWHKRHEDIQISMNGKLDMTYDQYVEMDTAIKEALMLLI